MGRRIRGGHGLPFFVASGPYPERRTDTTQGRQLNHAHPSQSDATVATVQGIQEGEEADKRKSYRVAEGKVGVSYWVGLVARTSQAGPQQQEEGLWKATRPILRGEMVRMRLHPDLRARWLNVYSTGRAASGRPMGETQVMKSRPMAGARAQRDGSVGGEVPVPGEPSLQRAGARWRSCGQAATGKKEASVAPSRCLRRFASCSHAWTVRQ